MARMIELPTFGDSRGELSVLEQAVPFPIRRVYFIHRAQGLRGGHRHRSNVQVLVAIAGSVRVHVNDGEARADYILDDPRRALETLSSLGCRAHLAISPNTPVERLEPYLDDCDGVLVMSVEPGYGGQRFNEVALEKLIWLAAARSRRNASFRLGVDGGISTETIGLVAAAGAELIVAGSAVIRSADYGRALTELEALARAAA